MKNLLRSSRSPSKAPRALASLALAVLGVAFLLCSSYSSFSLDELHRRLQEALPEQGRVLSNSTDESRIASNIDRPLHVLSLGGSVTWGASIAERTDAYPFMLASEILPPNSTVTNIAVRGTGAELAALCLQSMVLEGHAEQNPSVLDAHGGHDIDYDIITVEYSINGIKNLDLLLRRIRQRYPRAIIIYIQLYSWQGDAFDKVSGMRAGAIRDKIWEDTDRETAWEWGSNLHVNPAHHWAWREEHEAGFMINKKGQVDFYESELGKINGFLYQLPKHNKAANALPWFADDLHHINEAGHERVAHGVASIVDTHRDLLESHPQGPSPGWGDGGDQCVSWYSSGTSNQVHINKDVIPFAPSKFAAEVTMEDDTPLLLEVDNQYSVKMPLGLSTMSHEKVYPKAMVSVTSRSNDGDVMGQTEDSSHRGLLLDPFNRIPAFRKNHVVQSQYVGSLEPGLNVISIKPIETTEEPLRVTGLVICKDCGLEEMVPIDSADSTNEA